MKDSSGRKGNIISIRMSDEERDVIQKMMDSRNKKASFIMREAFSLFKEQWEMSRRMETPIEN
jgi:predicted transcriptional regulator